MSYNYNNNNNNNWNSGYVNRQPSNTPSYPNQNAHQNPQYGQTSNATYQAGIYQQPTIDRSNTPITSYSRQWVFPPSQNDSRAGETLSRGGAQESTAYGPMAGVAGSDHGSGTWHSGQQRTTSNVPQPATSTPSYENSLSRTTQSTYDSPAMTQPSTYGHGNSYSDNTQGNATYVLPRTSQMYNPVNDSLQRNSIGSGHPSRPTSSTSSHLQQNGRVSPVVPQSSMQRGHTDQLPGTGGPSRTHSMTPTQLQQARNAPPPPRPAPVQATMSPSQAYNPWPAQQRAAERAAEERKHCGTDEAKLNADWEAAARERERERERSQAAVAAIAAVEREMGRGPEHANALAVSAAESASSNAAASSPVSNAVEEEMRAMFKKMRQFNATDPALLAKLWGEERQAHLAKARGQKTAPPVPVTPIADHAVATASPVSTGSTKAVSTKKASSRAPDVQEGKTAGSVSVAPTPVTASKPPMSTEVPSTANQARTLTQAGRASSPAVQSGKLPWPPGRRELLAETGARWLNSRPENAGRPVHSNDLGTLLNDNPSYLNLCARLESMGVKIDRSAFAKALLTAVPDLNKPTARTETPATAITTSSSAATPATAHPATLAGKVAPSPAQASTSTKATVASEPPMVNGAYQAQPLPASPASSIKPTASQSGHHKWLNSLDRPLTKAETARKRVYDELAVISDENSDDDMPPPPKIQAIGQFGAFSHLPPSASSPAPDQTRQTPAPTQLGPKSTHSKSHNPRLAKLNGQLIVQPIKRAKAARRSSYDPRTIARDILLATGRHPEMRPLNGHLMRLQGLLTTYSQFVEGHNYDLASIRWDLLDPGDPLPDSDDDRVDAGSEADDESDSLSTSALARPTLVQPRTIELGDGTMTMITSMEGHIATSKLKGPGKRRGRLSKKSPPGSIQTLSAGDTNETNQFIKGLKRKGNNPAIRSVAAAAPGSTPQPTADRPQRDGTAPRAQQPANHNEESQPIKRKGGAVELGKAVHGKEANGIGSSGPAAPRAKSNIPSEVKRRGRPSTKKKPPPDPHYNVYHCRWEGCRAELHNLATLRKHVSKIHSDPNADVHTCRWATCSAVQPLSTADARGKGRAGAESGHLEFPTIDTWMAHVEDAHLLPLAEALGDGPRFGLSDAYDSESSQAYLSDTSGRIITPRATPLANVAEEDEAQSATLAPIMRRGMPRVRGRMTAGQQDDEIKLQQLEAKKLILGPLWDKGGATLVHERRRRGLYDDEEFEEEVEADDGPEPDWD